MHRAYWGHAPPVTLMLVPDLHAVICRYKDNYAGIERDGAPEEDPFFCVQPLDLDLVCVSHIEERLLDLPVHGDERLRDRLAGYPEVLRDPDVGETAAPEPPECKLPVVQGGEACVNNRKLTKYTLRSFRLQAPLSSNRLGSNEPNPPFLAPISRENQKKSGTAQ